MKRVILHIGMPKTGSSSIQRSLFGWDADDVRFPPIAGNSNHSIPLQALCNETPSQLAPFRRHARSEAYVQEQVERYRASLDTELMNPVATLVLSGEGMSHFGQADIDRLRALLAPSKRAIEVLCYVRDPISLSGSLLQQNLKMFGSAGRQLPLIDYRAKLDPWVNSFGPDSINFRTFDPASFPNGSVVEDFALVCGMDTSKISEKHLNESLSEAAVKLLWLFSTTMPVSTGRTRLTQARRELVRLIAKEFSGARFETPLSCLDPASMDNLNLDWLAQHAGIDFRERVADQTPHMKSASLEEFMNDLSTDTLDELDRLLERRKLTIPVNKPPAEKVVHLYLHLLAPEAAEATRDQFPWKRFLHRLKKRLVGA